MGILTPLQEGAILGLSTCPTH